MTETRMYIDEAAKMTEEQPENMLAWSMYPPAVDCVYCGHQMFWWRLISHPVVHVCGRCGAIRVHAPD